MERQPNTQYCLSISYGKDSLACLGAIEQLGLPLDRIIHAEVWATQDIPADLPPMVEFKAKADKIIKERWGIDVEHVCATKVDRVKQDKVDYETYFYQEMVGGKYEGSIKGFPNTIGSWCKKLKENAVKECQDKLTYEDIFYREWSEKQKEKQREKGKRVDDIYGFARQSMNYCTGELKQGAIREANKLTYEDVFYKARQRGNREGEIYGFPMIGGGWCQSSLKQRAINDADKFSQSTEQGAKINTVQYVGIAEDEPERLARLDGVTKISPLHLMGWTEQDAMNWCIENDLRSPLYDNSNRGGCWFCHNQGLDQLRQLRRDYPDLWAILMKWDTDSPVSFKADGHTVHDYDRRFELEDNGEVPSDRTFKWSMLDAPQMRWF